MGLGDGERLLRLFTDSFDVVDGVALFAGIPFNGVGIAQDDTGRCEFLRYVEGQIVGPFIEPLLDSDQSLMVFEDDSQTILVEDRTGLVRFEDNIFTGFAVERNRDDPRHLASVLEYTDGTPSFEHLEWEPSGQLTTFRRNAPQEGIGRVDNLFRWHPDGSIASSYFRVTLTGDGYSHSTDVEFDESGRLTYVAIDDWPRVLERLPNVREFARDRIYLHFHELAGLRAGQKLVLGPANTSELGLGVLLANDGMNDLEQIECCLSVKRVRQLIELPNLHHINFYNIPPEPESLELLDNWLIAKPGRKLIISNQEHKPGHKRPDQRP